MKDALTPNVALASWHSARTCPSGGKFTVPPAYPPTPFETHHVTGLDQVSRPAPTEKEREGYGFPLFGGM